MLHLHALAALCSVLHLSVKLYFSLLKNTKFLQNYVHVVSFSPVSSHYLRIGRRRRFQCSTGYIFSGEDFSVFLWTELLGLQIWSLEDTPSLLLYQCGEKNPNPVNILRKHHKASHCCSVVYLSILLQRFFSSFWFFCLRAHVAFHSYHLLT